MPADFTVVRQKSPLHRSIDPFYHHNLSFLPPEPVCRPFKLVTVLPSRDRPFVADANVSVQAILENQS